MSDREAPGVSDKPRILVLEDDPDMRTILTQVLEDQDYEVTAVDRGEKAVESARKAAFDLIVADIRMEGMNGLEAVAQAKQALPQLQSVIVSGYASPEETERARSLNVGGYLKKPFKMKEFLSLVRQQLAHRSKAKKRTARGLSHRDSMIWALEAVAEAYLMERPPVPPSVLREAGELMGQIADQLGLSGEVTEELRAATTLALLEETLQIPPDFLEERTLLPTLKTALAHRLERFENSPGQPFEARVLALVLGAVNEELESDPARFDPELLEVHKKLVIHGPDSPALRSGAAARKGKNLLTVARALEQVGEYSSALAAYKEAAQVKPPERDTVQALLGVARLSEDRDKSAAAALEAVEKSRLFGPVTSATTLLEGGVLLYLSQNDKCKELLKSAVASLERLGFHGEVVKAAIPLIRLGEPFPAERWPRLFKALLSPQHADDFSGVSGWLFADLLEALAATGSKDFYGDFLKVAHHHSYAITQNLAKGQLSLEAKEYLLSSLEQSKGVLSSDLVEQLQRDAENSIRERADKLQGSEQTAGPSLLRVRSFGVFEVKRGGETVPDARWKTQKTKHFFAFLAANWGKFVHEEQILEHFWPDDREKGKKNVYWATSVTRRCLREQKGDAEVLERKAESLRLKDDVPHWHDFNEFEAAYESGLKAQENGDLETARGYFRRLEQLYTGSYMEGCYLDWAVRRRDQCEKQLVDAMCRLAELSYEAGDYREALEASHRAVEHDACRQSAHLIAMRSFIELGQPEQAIEQYQDCEQRLRREYQIEPNTELIEVYYRARLGLPGSG